MLPIRECRNSAELLQTYPHEIAVSFLCANYPALRKEVVEEIVGEAERALPRVSALPLAPSVAPSLATESPVAKLDAVDLKPFAEDALKRGFSVFPLQVKSKITVPGSHGFKDATTNPEVLAEWDRVPDANIGVATGESNLCVLDFDKADNIPDWVKETRTFKVQTSRGLHVYFRGARPSKKLYLSGQHVGEIKSIGGYVLANGSVHPDGPIYTIVDDSPIVDTPDRISEFAESGKKPIDIRSSDRIPRGQHDITLTAIAGKLRRVGLEEDSLYNALVEICEKRCDDRGADWTDMCKKIAHSIAKKPVGDDGVPFFGSQRAALNPVTPIDVSTWREQFRSVAEMEEGDPVMVINGVLQEGTCIIGAVPGECKTLIAVAMSKAISDGTPLFGLPAFSVPERRPVIYLIPETRDRAFRKRCEAFKITQDKSWFMARTLSSGVPLGLTDPYLLEAVKQTKPVVFLDTAIRFMNGSHDENASTQNRELYNDVTTLLVNGAVCVVLIHHATKASKKEKMSLENMVRGSGDLAAMCDQVYGVQRDNGLYENGAGPLEIVIDNLKDREDTTGLTSLRLAASYKVSPFSAPISCIDETGNFRVVDAGETSQRNRDVIVRAVQIDPNRPAKDIAQATGQTEYGVKRVLRDAGYHSVQGGKSGSSPWHKDDGRACPYAKGPGKSVKVDLEPSKADRIQIGEAVEFLEALLTSDIPAKAVYSRADKVGIPEKLVKRAAKRLGVRITDGVFSKIPVQTDVIHRSTN